jgi:broad specificity phosphatase PhoE
MTRADPQPVSDPRPGAVPLRLILVRHGVTSWNETGRYQGLQDIPLGDSGRLQAERIRWRLREESISAAYTSDLRRARETAEIALGGHAAPLTLTSQLREMCFGAWEGLRHDEIARQFPDEWAEWTRAPASTCPPGGQENLDDLRARMAAFYESIVATAGAPEGAAERGSGDPAADRTEPRDWFSYRAAGQRAEGGGGTVLFVSHGGPIRALLAHLFALPIQSYWQFGIRPASVSILDVHPAGAIAEVIGDTSHLP